MKILKTITTALGALVFTAVLMPGSAHAIPAFARKQKLACNVCHTAFPQLNATGRKFAENGYRLPAKDAGVETTGLDLGSGIILDPFPGIAARITGMPLTYGSEDGGDASLDTEPLDSAELIALGSSSDHWSYMAHLEAESDEGFSPMLHGFAAYRFNEAATLWTGRATVWALDIYNTLDAERRLDHSAHSAIDYAGSTDVALSGDADMVGGRGRIGPLFWLAEVTPGPSEMESMSDMGGMADDMADPLDYAGRIGLDLSQNVSVGGFAYAVNTADASTVRPGLDFNAYVGASTLMALGMYDTTDQAMLGELGWDLSQNVTGDLWLVPLARVDLTQTSDATTFTPTAGVGIMQATGRVSVEVSDEVGSDGSSSPSAALIVDAVF